MDTPRNDDRDRPASTGSTEYRTRLLTKLNCLIAVLEVAIAKVDRSLEAPGANEERLQRVRGNLENTLSICHRAKRTLERALDAPGHTSPSISLDTGQMSYRDYVELSSIDEYRKFRELPPISNEDIGAVDIDALAKKLGES